MSESLSKEDEMLIEITKTKPRIIDVVIKDAADQSGWGLNRQSGRYLFE